MTELLFYTDVYVRNCEAHVITAEEHGIVLDRVQIEARPASLRSRPKIVSR